MGEVVYASRKDYYVESIYIEQLLAFSNMSDI